MWIIDEEKKIALNTKTGIAIKNEIELNGITLQINLTEIDLEIDKEILVLIPMYKICQVIDSLENFKFMDIDQINDYIKEELVNYIGG